MGFVSHNVGSRVEDYSVIYRANLPVDEETPTAAEIALVAIHQPSNPFGAKARCTDTDSLVLRGCHSPGPTGNADIIGIEALSP